MHRNGFSLASLLLLTAVLAVYLAAVSTVWLHSDQGQPEWFWDGGSGLDGALIFISAMCSLVVGPIVGLVVGVAQARPWPGALLGTCAGAVAGAACSLLLVVPGKTLPVVVGSLVIVLFGMAVRRWSGGPPQ